MGRIAKVTVWALSGLVTLCFVILLTLWLSPLPSIFLFAHAFSGNDTSTQAALERHVPPGIESTLDVAYGTGADERMDVYRPGNASGPMPLVLWVHGGGWVGGSKDGVANYLRILADPGYVTVAIDYSTAPGATYPTPLHQLNLALDHLVRNSVRYGIDSRRVYLAGDSAGAQIAAQMANITTNPEYALRTGITPVLDPASLQGTVLVSGAFDMTTVRTAGGLQGWFVNTVLWAYSGVRDFMDDEEFRLASITPYVSSDFPPTFITSGDADPLELQARALAARLKELAVPTEAVFFATGSGLNHEFQFNLDMPQARDTLAGMTVFLADPG